jgi:hypothetical protein
LLTKYKDFRIADSRIVQHVRFAKFSVEDAVVLRERKKKEAGEKTVSPTLLGHPQRFYCVYHVAS